MKTSRFISRSTALPVTISGVKEHLGIYHSEKDENLKILMEAACNAAEQFTGQIFRIGGDTIEQAIEKFTPVIDLDYSPATGVASVSYFDGSEYQTLATGNYTFLDYTTPQKVEFSTVPVATGSTEKAGLVRYVAGYASPATVPADVRAAILLITQHLYENPGDTVRQLPTVSEYLLRNYKVH